MTLRVLVTALVLVGCQAPAPVPVPAPAPKTFPVAVTVDDLPVHGPDYPGLDRVLLAKQMLATFQAHGVAQVYGFVNGHKLEGHPEYEEILRLWQAAGYPLANHGWSHRSLNDLTAPAYTEEITRNQTFLDAWHAPRIYRYPYLQEGNIPERRAEVRAWLAAQGYQVAPVTIDFDDWAWNPPYARCRAQGDELALAALRQSYREAALSELAVAREMQQTLFGRELPQIVLLHIGAMDVDQLDAFLDAYEDAGARFVTLEEALQDPAFQLDPGIAWNAGTSMQYQHWRARRNADPSFPKAPRAPRDLDALSAACFF